MGSPPGYLGHVVALEKMRRCIALVGPDILMACCAGRYCILASEFAQESLAENAGARFWPEIKCVWQANMRVDGADKVWK